MADDDLLVRAAIRDELSGPLQNIRDELRRTARQVDDTARRANVGARGFDRMAGGAGRLARFAGGALAVGVGAGALALTAAGTAAATMGIKTAAAMQNAKVAFTTMLGSGKAADSFLKDLAAFAASTPFEFPELQTAASSLISAGIEADKVIPIMTSLGNATSGMGTGSEGVQRATVALQQMSAAGRITGEDLNQLRDAGIPVFDLLAAATGKSKTEVAGLAQAGKLGAKELAQLMKALETGKGLERFNGLMEKQSQTLGGVWSTLSDTVNMGLADAFEPAIPILTDLTLKASDASGVFLGKFKTGLADAIALGKDLNGSFQTGGLDAVAQNLEDRFGVDFTGALDKAKTIIDDVVTVVRDGLAPALGDVSTVLPGILSPLTLVDNVLGFMADHTTLTHGALTTLITVLTVAKGITVAMALATAAKNVIDGIQLLRLMALTPGTAAYAVATGAATLGTTLWGVATTIAAGAMAVLTSPITLVVAGLALLVGGLILAYKKSDTFRAVVDGAFHAVGEAGRWLWNKVLQPVFRFLVNGFATVMRMYASMLRGLSHVPGFGWARDAANKLDGAADKANALADGIRDIPPRKRVEVHYEAIVPSSAQMARVDAMLSRGQGGVVGDTHTSRARGRGNLANTFAAHHMITRATGARPTITNALIGGGGKGRGSGDHQAGRALDLVGSGLHAYARATKAAGGYAAFHGTGATRHLHAVPPAMGDTSTSMAARVRTRTAGGSAGGVVIEAGAVVVHVTNPGANVDVAQAVADGIRDYLRDQEERS